MASNIEYGLLRERAGPSRHIAGRSVNEGVCMRPRTARHTAGPQSASKIKIEYIISAAIDIGTSSSCYAFSDRSRPTEVKMNKNWGGQANYQSSKTPTTILTEPGPRGKFVAFGFEAEMKYRDMSEGKEYELYTDFKMILYREKRLKLKETMATSLSGKTKRPLMDLYVMTLKYLRDHMMNEINAQGTTAIPGNEIRWVLCVPATWHEKAKEFLRHAAYKVKLIDDVQSSQLVILLEATAAAMSCQRPENRVSLALMQTELEVTEGIRYFVIDAGAGTVDFTAQQDIGDGRVKELAIANGGDWGGRHVDKRFTDLLIEILGALLIDKFKQKHPMKWYNLEMSFEKAKANVDENKPIRIEIPTMLERFMREEEEKDICKVINNKSKETGVSEKNGCLVLTEETVRKLFEPSLRETGDRFVEMLDSDQLEGLKIVYLVGGFGGCKLLQKHLKKLRPGHQISVPIDARAAVVQGAVIYGHNPDIITRVAKKTYGVATYSDFKPDRHSAVKRTAIGSKVLCKDLFLPFCRMGEELPQGKHGEMVADPVKQQATSITVDFYYLDRPTNPNEVLYIDSPGVQKHGTVRVDNIKGEVTLNFTFTDEIKVVARDKSSAVEKQIKLQFDYDVSK